jgi:hypothetical protein
VSAGTGGGARSRPPRRCGRPARQGEQVALIPQCAECLKVWLPQDADRWRAHLDTEDELVFYCPACAKKEFG